MSDLFEDTVFAWRNAIKKPGTSLLIVLTLALGIGANSAMFSVVYHVLLAPLPYEDGDRLVKLEQRQQGLQDSWWSVPTFVDFREQNGSFAGLVEYVQFQYALLGQGKPVMVQTGVVNWDFFEMLGIRPVLGRGLVASDGQPGAAPVMLLSQPFWKEKFGGAEVLGRSLEMNGIVYQVIGVLPDMLAYPHYNDVWIPGASDLVRSNEDMVNFRDNEGFITHVLGKLREEISAEQAAREVETLAARLRADYPDIYPSDYTVALKPVKEELIGLSGTTFLLLLGLAFLVLLIAAANAANFILARMNARSQELAIREAVGASPSRIARQSMTESVVFALAGGFSGLLIAYPCLDFLAAFTAGYSPLGDGIRMSGALLGFSFCLTLLVGVLSGSAAAFGKRDINKLLKEGGDRLSASTSGTRRREFLLLLQFALSFIILIFSALFMLSLQRLSDQDAGFESRRVLVVNTELTPPNYATPESAWNFQSRLLAEVQALPGVEGAAIAQSPLLQDDVYNPPPIPSLLVEGRGAPDPLSANSRFTVITEDYFRVLGIPLLKGRAFAESDESGTTPVTVINESLEKSLFPAGDALGKRISTSKGQNWLTIIGVVGNVRSQNLGVSGGPTIYRSLRQGPASLVNLYVKSNTDLNALAERIEVIIAGLDPELPTINIKPLEEIRSEWLAPTRLRALLIGLFAVLALLMTVSGVIAAVSFNISQRIREIGIRAAVGASPVRIFRLLLLHGLRFCFAGIVVGLGLMLVLAPFVEPFLYRTEALSPPIYLAGAGILILTVVGAAGLPAGRASRMSPITALRAE